MLRPMHTRATRSCAEYEPRIVIEASRVTHFGTAAALTRRALAIVVLATGCGSNTPTSGTGSSAGAFPPPPGDAGDAAAALVQIYSECAGVPAPLLTAGAWTEPRSGATLHWPAGWMQADPSSGNGATAPYTYVPTGATATTSAQANVTVSPSGVSSDAQGQEVLQGAVNWAKGNAGNASQITMGGYPAVVWWDQEAPPQLGCAMCTGGDPGPDYVVIGAEAYLGNSPTFGGLTVVEVQGRARVNAQPPDIICDMQAMVLGVTFSK